MPYKFKCADIGMNCGFSVKGSSPGELMPKIAEHAKTAHKIDEINEDLKKKVQEAIKKTMF
jgi:predicted small metal-binding protein